MEVKHAGSQVMRTTDIPKMVNPLVEIIVCSIFNSHSVLAPYREQTIASRLTTGMPSQVERVQRILDPAVLQVSTWALLFGKLNWVSLWLKVKRR